MDRCDVNASLLYFITMPTALEISKYRESTGVGISMAKTTLIRMRLIEYIKTNALNKDTTKEIFLYLLEDYHNHV
jgi:hypothetical protein